MVGLKDCKLCAPGKYQPSRGNEFCNPCDLGHFCLEGATTPSVCGTATIRLTLGAANQSECEPSLIGTYAVAGLPMDCPIGTFQPDVGGANANDCTSCPDYSTTLATGKTVMEDCVCQRGFIAAYDAAGVRFCVCDFGEGLVTLGGIDSCVACERGKYKPRKDNGGCDSCDDGSQSWTTAAIRSTKYADCICDDGYVLAPIFPNISDSSAAAVQGLSVHAGLPAVGHECIRCRDTWTPQSEDSTNCTGQIGLTLDKLPVMPGFFRDTNLSKVVRWCSIDGACVGGTDWAHQCAQSQMGAFCGVCRPNYIAGGADSLCNLCEGDPMVSIAVTISMPLIAIALLAILFSLFNRFKSRLLKELMPDQVQTLAGEDPEDLWAEALEKAQKQLGIIYPRTFGRLQWLAEHSASFSVRFKIIVSLMQVINGIGTVFTVRFPPIFKQLLSTLGTLFLVDLDLPTMMPMGCFVDINFYSSLMTKTVGPMVICLFLNLVAWIMNKFFAKVDKEAWDIDGDGVIDREEFMSARPKGKVIADMCDSVAFLILFFVYPSASVSTLQFFVCDVYDGDGDSGYNYLLKDYSVDCASSEYGLWTFYAFAMIALYPLGIPTYYASVLFKDRHTLLRLQRLQIEKDGVEAEIKARRGTVEDLDIQEFERAELMKLLGTEEMVRVEKKRKHLLNVLPIKVKKLTNGYTDQAYFFEVFECARKIALVGIPVMTDPGSVEQRAFGMVICFFTTCLLSYFNPYVDQGDNFLAIIAQFEIAIVLICAMVLEAYPGSVAVDILMTGSMAFLGLYTIFLEMNMEIDPAEDMNAAQNIRFIGPVLKKTIQAVKRTGTALHKCVDYVLGVEDQEQVRETTRKSRAVKHPELTQRHRMASWRCVAVCPQHRRDESLRDREARHHDSATNPCSPPLHAPRPQGLEHFQGERLWGYHGGCGEQTRQRRSKYQDG